MEEKKAKSVNPENRRAEHFLLAIVVILASVFTFLEYNNMPDSNTDDSSLIDELTQDIALTPAEDTKDMIAAEAPAPQTKQTLSEKIKVTEKEQTDETPDKNIVTDNPLVVGDGEGAAKDANVSEAIQQTPAQNPDADKPLKISVVEQLPEFPGGMTELMKWLTKNLKYPVVAQQKNIQGKVVVSFIINKDGSIATPKIEHSVHPYLDREALRIVRMMPRWKPGMEHDKPCRTMFAIPIVFQL